MLVIDNQTIRRRAHTQASPVVPGDEFVHVAGLARAGECFKKKFFIFRVFRFTKKPPRRDRLNGIRAKLL